MNKQFHAAFFALFAIILVFSGCTAPCNYPDQRGVIVRIINAMPDMPMITVFINGKLLLQDFPYDPPSTDLYVTSYKDGTSIVAGDSALFIVTSDALGKDTVAKGKVLLNFDRQTVIVMGRGHIKPPMKPTSLIVRLDDQSEESHSTQTFIRFINAVPDLDSLDVFFKGDATGTPDLTLHYGKVYPHIPLSNIQGLTVTESGHPNNVIFSFQHSFIPPGVYVTALIRGESKPIGTDFTAAPLVISDVVPGIYLISFKTFAVRLVNASRDTQSLWIRSNTVSPEDTLNPRGSRLFVEDYPNQPTVLFVPPKTTTDYIPLNISLNRITTFWFAKDNNIADTISFTDTAMNDRRFSKIAIEENAFGSSGKKLSHLNLPDTMTNPSGNFGRVRIINLSPDDSAITVSSGARNNVTMIKKQVEFFDVPINNPTLTLKDGSTSMSYTLPVSPVTPISVYLLPEQSATPSLPIMTSNDD